MNSAKQQMINSIIEKYKDCLNETNAQKAIDELLVCRADWDECRYLANYRYNFIIHIIGYGYFLLKKYADSAQIINEGLTVLNEDYPEYAHKPKSQLYEILGHDYCFLGSKDEATEAFRMMVYYDMFSIGSTAYTSVPFYSFRGPGEFSIKDLADNTISLSSVFDFNDPVDSAFFPWMNHELETASEESQKIFVEAMTEAYRDIRARCFVTDRPLPTPENRTPVPYENIPPYLNTIMWAHYADYHKGFCAVYNIPVSAVTAHPKEGYAIALHQIDYVETMPFTKNISFKEGFLTKSKRWEYEHEVRMLYYSKDKPSGHPTPSLDDHPLFPTDKPKNALTAVYLGYKCEKKNEIIQAVEKYPNVDIYEMQISEDDIYTLKAVLIKKGKKS